MVNPTSPNYPDTFNDRTDQGLALVGRELTCNDAHYDILELAFEVATQVVGSGNEAAKDDRVESIGDQLTKVFG